MSSSESVATLDADIRPSWLIGGTLIAAHAGAVVCVMLTVLPLWARLLLAAVTGVSTWLSVARYATLRRSDAITGVRCDNGQRWFVRFRSGDFQPVTLLPTSYRNPGIVVLNLRLNDSKKVRSVILTIDNIDSDAFRRLRVRLLLARSEFVPQHVRRSTGTDIAWPGNRRHR